MTPQLLKRAPLGHGIWGVILALVIAVVLVQAYVAGPRSGARGMFAVASLVLLIRQVMAFRSKRTEM